MHGLMQDRALDVATLMRRAESEYMEDTWTWDGASWTRVGTQASKHPEARYGGRMAFDPSRGRAYVSDTPHHIVWTYAVDANGWPHACSFSSQTSW